MAAWQAGSVVAARYRLAERLGAGGVAEVWRAHDSVLQRDVAVKLLLQHVADDEDTVTRFRREASTAAGIAHPHAVVVFDVGEHEGAPLLVMELVDGPTLASVLAAGPLPPVLTAAVGHQIAGALGAAHARGLVHRDVKPANVLLSSTGGAKLADFGIATALGPAHSRLTDPGSVVGTAGYLAPEQLSADVVDARSDVYALGLVLHECLTGRPPFGEGTATEIAARRLAHDPPPLRGLDLPEELLAAIVTATRREPEHRYPDGDHLAAALAPLVPDDADRRLAALRAVPRTEPLPVDASHHTDRVATTRVVRRSGRPVTRAPGGTVAPPPAAAERPGGDGRRRARRVLPVVAALVVVAGVLAIGLTAGGDDDATAAPVPAAVAGAQDVDPAGDGREHRDEVPAAYDGDPASAWSTERYEVADLSLIKSGERPGVGLVFDLGEVRALRALRLATSTPGVRFEVFAWEQAPDTGSPPSWGEPTAVVEDAGEDVEVALTTEARYVLLWFTRLAPVERGFRARVHETTFLVAP